MAHHKSAKIRIRRNARRAVINGERMSRIRTFVKKVELAIAGGDKNQAKAALKEAEPQMARGVTKGLVHRNTMARRMSRLSARIKGMPG